MGGRSTLDLVEPAPSRGHHGNLPLDAPSEFRHVAIDPARHVISFDQPAPNRFRWPLQWARGAVFAAGIVAAYAVVNPGSAAMLLVFVAMAGLISMPFYPHWVRSKARGVGLQTVCTCAVPKELGAVIGTVKTPTSTPSWVLVGRPLARDLAVFDGTRVTPLPARLGVAVRATAAGRITAIDWQLEDQQWRSAANGSVTPP